jgi:chaperonin GroES
MDVKIGDRVLFSKHAGQTIKVDGQELHILREDDVMAIVE